MPPAPGQGSGRRWASPPTTRASTSRCGPTTPTRVEVCLFDEDGTETAHPARRADVPRLARLPPRRATRRSGTASGCTVRGTPRPGTASTRPSSSPTPTPARSTARLTYDDRVFGHVRGGDTDVRDDRDSAPYVPRSVVVRDDFDWGDDRPPRVPWADTVVYEAHVRGLTAPPPRRPRASCAAPTPGSPTPRSSTTSPAWASPRSSCCRSTTSSPRRTWPARAGQLLGLQLPRLLRPGVGLLLHRRAGAAGQRVQGHGQGAARRRARGHPRRRLQPHGRGRRRRADALLPRARQRVLLQARQRPARATPTTPGCGNTLDLSHPHVLQLVMDSLRYWVQEMHVDGFRFDLASALARSLHDVDMLSGFLTTIQQDPVLSQVKLIAEPWDVGAGGYQVGEFPPLWSEWNDQYRDTVRDFWRGRSGGVRAPRLPALRLVGPLRRRRPTPVLLGQLRHRHDGFTLRDLVTYDDKHNEANGEDNRDGTDDNRSWNHGVEGETDDPEHPGRAAPHAPQPARHPAAVHRRPDAHRRRRDGTHPGRQQQRLLPGQRDLLGRLGPRAVAGRPARVRPHC